MRQASLFPSQPRLFHGGELARRKRKTLRPLSRRHPIHLVLKARHSLREQGPLVTKETRKLAEKFGLRIYSFALASDHLHLVVKIPGRCEYLAFIRSLSGLLARKLGKGLWALLPFSRVATWGRDFARLIAYLKKNREEASGERSYEPRKDWYRRFRTEGE
jgi:REP element-mobilizing transposase RayT